MWWRFNTAAQLVAQQTFLHARKLTVICCMSAVFPVRSSLSSDFMWPERVSNTKSCCAAGSGAGRTGHATRLLVSNQLKNFCCWLKCCFLFCLALCFAEASFYWACRSSTVGWIISFKDLAARHFLAEKETQEVCCSQMKRIVEASKGWMAVILHIRQSGEMWFHKLSLAPPQEGCGCWRVHWLAVDQEEMFSHSSSQQKIKTAFISSH